ncbi:lipase family protein [Marinitenerispora sediminis]|uniref:Lipase n=1 Tax=Marinitenerispora sediminis TaxID=1931232 RepID=A0A368T5T6_9ACTN|nr:lipase family protein [Marinitenerispora sediminis]RCV49205.1 lipase [Marinitenerispora sediminis]RCV51538.1 lipase [Marinitenerispora sediminis]RCV55119.1 lipase [Marinitenerispora sediminis]
MTEVAFDHAATAYGLPHAHCLAQAAALAYHDADEVAARTAAWGFPMSRSFRVAHRPPFPLEDTEGFVAASDRMIVVAFRGTEPAELRDWLSDANAAQVPHSARRGRVHSGFAQALDAVYPELHEAVTAARTDGQSLWFTGHSLGGALAMLAAARMYFDDPDLLADGVYTFGQPRTCDPELATAYDEAFRGRMFRFVNNNDIVAQLPPEPLYRHVAAEMYIDSQGRLRDKKASFLGGAADRVRGHTADLFAPGADGVRDHFIKSYLAALGKLAG